VQLTDGPASDEYPVYAPGGDAIAFIRTDGTTFNVWTMNVDGSGQEQLVGEQSDKPAYGSLPMRCHGRWATIVGTAGGDDLRGSTGSDVIVGRGGNDTIDGGRGNDMVCGGGGTDTVHGDLGADHLYGGNGADQLYGDPGPDVLHGDAGADLVVGGVGPDRLFGESGSDVLGALDHQHDRRIDCGPGHDHARWDHHRDPHPHSC
jgi:Ca2+-binding RTX toxin-like protein